MTAPSVAPARGDAGRSFDPYDAQHDLHCWLTFMGWDWKIDEMRGLSRIGLVREGQDGVLVYGMVNMARVDLAAYCEAATRWAPGFPMYDAQKAAADARSAIAPGRADTGAGK